MNSTYTYVTYIATTSEKLWTALTDGEESMKYFFGQRIQSDWEKDSVIRFEQPGGQVAVTGAVQS